VDQDGAEQRQQLVPAREIRVLDLGQPIGFSNATYRQYPMMGRQSEVVGGAERQQ
jgi:hypothetical protein